MKHNAFYPQSEALERWDDGNFISSLIFESLFHLKKILSFFSFYFVSISINISQNLVKHQRERCAQCIRGILLRVHFRGV